MDHAALDGPGPHDGHLDHQVVEPARLQSRQHRHLGPALDLEHAHGVGTADHVVGFLVLVLDVLQREGIAAPLAHEIEAAAQRREHAQRQHVDLEQAHVLQVVLVPLDDGAVGHGRVFHRHQPRELALRQHETAHVLAQVPGKAAQGFGQLQPLPHPQFADVHARFSRPLAQALHLQPVLVEPVMLLGERIDQPGRNAQRLAHVADGAAGAVAGDHRRDGGAVAAVLP